ncbi:MAG TPA: rhodanese-like domain-containing protein [Geobacteraceae bacterium]
MKDGFVITADEVRARLKSGEQLFFVNLRHHQDWDLAVMKARGALRLPDNEVELHSEEIPRERPVVVYSTCPGDEPSIRAARFLQEHGWNDAHALIGGFKAYCQAGLPVEEIGEGSSVKKIMLL